VTLHSQRRQVVHDEARIRRASFTVWRNRLSLSHLEFDIFIVHLTVREGDRTWEDVRAGGRRWVPPATRFDVRRPQRCFERGSLPAGPSCPL